jgi:amidase
MVSACLEQGVFTPVDRTAQLAAGVAVYQRGAVWSQFLQDHPVALSPVCCERPWLVGEDISRIAEIGAAMRMVVPVNILGLPSCAAPVGCDEGVQLIGARFREDLLLDAAQVVEERAPVLTPIQPRVAVGA